FKGYSQGAVDYLLKPFDPEILRTKVSVFVDLWRRGELIKRQAAMLRVQELRELERRSEVRFHGLTDSMPQCVWAARRDGEIHYCNRVWREYAGPEAGPSFFGGVPLDELPAVQAAWTAAIRGGRGLEREQRLRRHDGELRWHLCRVVAERDEHGAIVGWIATATDIDHQKRVEEAYAALLLREQEARAQLEEANRSKDEFLATVSHELRTPLNAILGWSHILRGGKPDEATVARGVEVIERNAQTQAQLIEDILDASRVITGSLRLSRGPVDLATVINAATDSVRLNAETKGIQLAVILDPAARHVTGDASRLQQVVWNLLANAIKFTASGGGVEVRLQRADGRAQITVTDTGEGVAAEFLPFIFDRFRQADSTITRRHGGLGLGLAIVRHLVELHEGIVQAESAGEGYGSSFSVRLPLAEHVEGARIGPAAAGGAPPALQGAQILVVDDDQDALDMLTLVLTGAGARPPRWPSPPTSGSRTAPARWRRASTSSWRSRSIPRS
ncbi:MAG TPA: ATP-binding protein, partial [Methylomirabilota bacterium]